MRRVERAAIGGIGFEEVGGSRARDIARELWGETLFSRLCVEQL